jgi:uncharacterized protein YutE (UPF0331/DUF86 family)
MPIDKELIYKLLENLKEAILKIEKMDVTFDMISADEDIQDLLDRRMQVAIEVCIDIAAHLSASLSLQRKERASDMFLLLTDNKILSKDTAVKMAGASGLRNIIVHEYTDIDYKLAYSDLDDKLDDLRTFASEVLDFLKKQES